MKTAVRVDTQIDLGVTNSGAAFGTENIQGYSICVHWSGGNGDFPTLIGNWKVQACNNPFTNNVNLTPDPDAVWVDISGSEYTITTNTGDYFWNVSDCYYRAFRLVYTSLDGSNFGSATAYIFAKGIQ